MQNFSNEKENSENSIHICAQLENKLSNNSMDLRAQIRRTSEFHISLSNLSITRKREKLSSRRFFPFYKPDASCPSSRPLQPA